MAELWIEKAKAIMNDYSFNDLPFEQRKHISKFMRQQQILTLWQAIHNYAEYICPEYKRRMSLWLHQCVCDYEKEFGITENEVATE